MAASYLRKTVAAASDGESFRVCVLGTDIEADCQSGYETALALKFILKSYSRRSWGDLTSRTLLNQKKQGLDFDAVRKTGALKRKSA